MTQLYVGIGHGIMPDGRYDPGAVHGHLVEHDLAKITVEAMVVALERSGFHDFYAETSRPGHVDPDYRGSVTRANQLGARWVMEVHYNASGTPASGHGTETLCYADSGPTGAWAHRVQAALDAVTHLTNRGVKERTDLWLLRGTTGHALIPEVAFVDGDAAKLTDHPEICRQAGEALAKATLAQLGHRYIPPGAARYQVAATNAGPGGSYPNVDECLAAVRHQLAVGATQVTITHRAG